MNATKSATQKFNTTLPIVTLVLGLVLLTYMITVESEPGGIPLILILIGSIWYLVARLNNRKHIGGD